MGKGKYGWCIKNEEYVTRATDIQKLIRNWEEESEIELSPEQRKKLHERIEKLAKEEFKTGMAYQTIRIEGIQADKTIP